MPEPMASSPARRPVTRSGSVTSEETLTVKKKRSTVWDRRVASEDTPAAFFNAGEGGISPEAYQGMVDVMEKRYGKRLPEPLQLPKRKKR
jgi:hypothetical protein